MPPVNGLPRRCTPVVFFLLCVSLWLIPLPGARANVSVGAVTLRLSDRVVDTTDTLDAPTRERLVAKLASLEQRSGAQLVVVMLPSTGDVGIESFSNKLFNAWRLGRKGVDDGILMVIAKDDRRMRIEVGYGLGGAVPDVLASRIIREDMTPAFREGDYAGGVEHAVDDLTRLVDGEPLPKPATPDVPLEAWMLLAAFALGGVVGVLLTAGKLGWRWALALAVGMLMLVGATAEAKDLWATVLLVGPLCMLTGGAIFGALWTRRVVFYAVLGLIAYCIALGVVAVHVGGRIFIYALGLPLLLVLLLGMLWLLVLVMRTGYRQNRRRFLVVMGILAAIYAAFGLFSTARTDGLNWLAPLPFMYLLILLLFTRSWRSGGRGGSGSSGGSSGGSSSSFSGGGGSSGGGGASGSW